MAEPWLPIGHEITKNESIRKLLFSGRDWQIYKVSDSAKGLIANSSLFNKWRNAFLEDGEFIELMYGEEIYYYYSSQNDYSLLPLSAAVSPHNKNEALSFAAALMQTRKKDAESPLQDAIYVEKLSLLLPTFDITEALSDDILLGRWLTGGANVSVSSHRRIAQMLSWLEQDELTKIVNASGLKVRTGKNKKRTKDVENEVEGALSSNKYFYLPGRAELEIFFNEHIIDIVNNADRYLTLGIEFPSAVILHGPPGCGKTFAVQQLVEFLGWPVYEIEASSIASPYIHETSRKVAEVFDNAISNAPSIIVIDEMEAFLADRDSGTGHHRVEEVGEFLRRIPEAVKNKVLILGMTNRLEMIDPAILRRGRFDHLIEVGFPTVAEITSLIEKLTSAIPVEGKIDVDRLAIDLQGRPLSDVAYIIRESARLAARAGESKLSQAYIDAASAAAAPRSGETSRRIGFLG